MATLSEASPANDSGLHGKRASLRSPCGLGMPPLQHFAREPPPATAAAVVHCTQGRYDHNPSTFYTLNQLSDTKHL